MAFSVENLTLGELSLLEDKIGMPIGKAENAPTGQFMAMLVMLKMRREDLKYTLKDAEKLTLTEANEILGIGDSADLES